MKVYSDNGEYKKISDILMIWGCNNRRDFAWRHTQDPYKILVAEKILQQTAAGPRVVSAYNKLIERFPTIDALSTASEDHLSDIFVGLGLMYRAKELISLSKSIKNNYDGQIPSDFKKLLSLIGIGEYIARAVLSFGFNQDFAIVDTNVSRLLYRLFGLTGKRPQNPARNKRLTDIAQSLLPLGKSRSYNYAVLDFCAKVCIPREPLCGDCPLKNNCCYWKSIERR